MLGSPRVGAVHPMDCQSDSLVNHETCSVQTMLEAFVRSGPSAPLAGLPVMSELLKRMADLDEEEADVLLSLGSAVPQVMLRKNLGHAPISVPYDITCCGLPHTVLVAIHHAGW